MRMRKTISVRMFSKIATAYVCMNVCIVMSKG